MRAVLLLVAAVAAALAVWFVADRDLIGGQPDLSELPVAERAARLEKALLAEPDAALSEREAYERLAETVPSPLSLSIGRFEDEGAGVVARDVELTLAAAPDFVMAVDAVRAYGLDADAVEALDGDADASRLLAARLDLQGVRLEGLETLSARFMTAFTEDMGGMLGEDALAAEELPTIGEYDLAMDRLTIDGLSLRGGLPAIDGDGPEAVLRRFVAASMAYGFDRAIMREMRGGFTMIDGTAQEAPLRQTAEFRLPSLVYGSYDRGDIAFQLAGGMEMTQSVVGMEGAAPLDMTLDLTVGVYAVEDLRLANVLRAFAMEEWPTGDETDFLSAGRWTVEDMVYGVGEEPIYIAERQVLDMTEFHGLLPTRIENETSDAWHLGAFLRLVRSLAETSDAEGMSEEELAKIDDLIALLDAEDLAVLRMENRTDYRWTPEDGAATLDVLQKIDGVLTASLDLTGSLPPYAALSAIDAQSEEVGDLVGEAFVSRSELDRFGFALTDEGGLDKALRVMIAYAEAMPDDEVGQLAMLRGNEPSALRAMGAAGITMGGAQLAGQAPELGEFTKAAAAFVQSGGTLDLVVDPEPALNAANAQGVSALAADPAALIERLGLSLTHMPASEDTAAAE